MKKIFLLLITAIIFSYCGTNKKNNPQNDSTITQTDTIKLPAPDTIKSIDTTKTNNSSVQNNKDYTAHYICPNHCPGSGSDQPGTCPVCGMELIENPDWANK